MFIGLIISLKFIYLFMYWFILKNISAFIFYLSNSQTVIVFCVASGTTLKKTPYPIKHACFRCFAINLLVCSVIWSWHSFPLFYDFIKKMIFRLEIKIFVKVCKSILARQRRSSRRTRMELRYLIGLYDPRFSLERIVFKQQKILPVIHIYAFKMK